MIAALKYWQIGAGLLLGILLAAGPVYLYGASQGRQQAAVAAVKETAKAYEERATTDHKVHALDAAALCLELGGLPNECAELRRLEENPGQTGNGGLPRRK